MAKLNRYGFFAGLSCYDSNESVQDYVNLIDKTVKDQVILYLNSGPYFVFSPGVVSDVLSNEEDIISSMSTRTDGVWEWPDSLSYYVEKYNIGLPEEFIQHMLNMNWEIPKDIDLIKLCDDND